MRAYNREVRLVFTSGKSLKDMLVCSSFGPQVCPKTMYQIKEKKGKGRPPECRACDAGIVDGRCLSKNVVYSMVCSVCESEYVGETERCLRDRFREHWQQARASTPNTPWGAHFAAHHGAQPRPSSFTNATILATVPCHVDSSIMEALLIRERSPSTNRDCGRQLI